MADIESVGVGTPGSVNQDTGMIEFSNNLAFNNVPAKKMLEELTGKPCYFENDANAACAAECWVGAGKGKQNMVMISLHSSYVSCVALGSGIGAGIVVNGRIIHGGSGWAGEPGHSVGFSSVSHTDLQGERHAVRLWSEGLLREVRVGERLGLGDEAVSR